ncbi:hypothetical protein TNCV_2336611 [Trichonephila clavipes]|nr:hypothetical protein TNCV_2336611 [Trichonephila clavipes]
MRSHNYIGDHGRKAIGGAVRKLAASEHLVSSFQTWTACNEHESLYDCRVGGNPLHLRPIYVEIRLYGERYPTRCQPNHQAITRVYQILAEHGSFRFTIDDTSVNSEIGLVA